MKKKILAVMLSAVMAVTMLVGCGDSVETGGRAERKKTEIQDTNDKSRTESEEPNEILRLVQGIQYNSDGSVFAHEEWEYNADGDLVKDTTYKSDGSISGGTMVEYERNAAGDVTKAVSYGLSDGNIRGWYEIEGVSMGAKGSCFVPMDLEDNVVWLHQYLFNQNNYKVSNTVQEISAQILEDASKYMSE